MYTDSAKRIRGGVVRESGRRCILCLRLIEGHTKPEHILLNALGGRVKVRSIICSECNAEMGRGPDKDLADSVSLLRNIGNLLSGDGGSSPILHMESEGVAFAVKPGMQVKRRQGGKKKVSVSKQGDEIDISISAETQRELDSLMNCAARAVAKELGHSEPAVVEAIRQDLLSNHNRSDAIVPGPAIKGEMQFGAGRSQQSMAKATLVLWARLVGSEEVVQPRYHQIRSFIWSGGKPENPEELVKIDFRPVPEMPNRFGENPNIIQVVSDDLGAVYGYFRLYGAVGWRVLLCKEGAPSSMTCCLISNPLQNNVFYLGSDPASILPPTWILAEWSPDIESIEAVTKQLRSLMSYGSKVCRNLMIRDWVFKALDECGYKEGEPITENHLEKISDYVSKRMFVYLTKLPIKSSTKWP